MSLEDQLRAVMREHDSDASTGLRFTPPPPRSARRYWLPAVAAAAVAAIAVGIAMPWSDSSHRPDTTTAPARDEVLACPSEFHAEVNPSSTDSGSTWVPSPPQVSDADRQLVPDATPMDAVVCSFVDRADGAPKAAYLLTGHRPLDGDLSSVPASLALLPTARDGVFSCAAYAAQTDDDNYLLGLRYPAGTLWVSIPGNHCLGSGNGRFESRTNLRESAAAAFASGEWPRAQERKDRNAPCPSTTTGRLGDGQHLVPSGAVSVAVCHEVGPATRAKFFTGRTLARLVDELDALPTIRELGCQQHGDSGERYSMWFRYPTGPSVNLALQTDCTPELIGPALSANAPANVVEDVARLAGR